jgi:hypothetical protein
MTTFFAWAAKAGGLQRGKVAVRLLCVTVIVGSRTLVLPPDGMYVRKIT